MTDNAITGSVPSVPLEQSKPPGGLRRRRLLIGIANHSLLIAAAIIFLLPFAFMLMTALMSQAQTLSPNLFPHPIRFQNFADIFHTAPLVRWMLNTLEYSFFGTLGLLISSIPIAYALAHLRWRGRNIVLLVVLVAMMLPPQVSVVSVYVFWYKVHQVTGITTINSLLPLIIPNWLGDAFSIFLLRQFFMTIPQEYLDAARVDGCGELRILTSVVIRLAKPAIAAVTLFSVLYTFNDFFLPLLYTDQAHWPLSIGLANFRTLHQVQWNLTMAATLLVMMPVIILFFMAQKAFVEGVTLTGVKG